MNPPNPIPPMEWNPKLEKAIATQAVLAYRAILEGHAKNNAESSVIRSGEQLWAVTVVQS